MSDRKSFHNVIEPRPKIYSGNAGDEKNLHPGGRKFIFLTDFPEILPLLLLFFLVFFGLFARCFLKLKMNILIHIRHCGRIKSCKKFTDFRKQDYFFWLNKYLSNCILLRLIKQKKCRCNLF